MKNVKLLNLGCLYVVMAVAKSGGVNRAATTLYRTHSPARGLFKSLLDKINIPLPTPTIETGDLAIIRTLLLNTDMVALVSEHQLHYERTSGQLVSLDIPMPETQRDIGFTRRTGSTPSPAADVLIKAIREITENTYNQM